MSTNMRKAIESMKSELANQESESALSETPNASLAMQIIEAFLSEDSINQFLSAWLDQADGQISVDKNGDHCFVIYGNDVEVSSKRINIMTTIIEDLAKMDEEQRKKAKLETIRWIDKMRDAVDKC